LGGICQRLRLGLTTNADIANLNSRLIPLNEKALNKPLPMKKIVKMNRAAITKYIKKLPNEVLCLAPRWNTVTEMNEDAFESLPGKPYTIWANDHQSVQASSVERSSAPTPPGNNQHKAPRAPVTDDQLVEELLNLKCEPEDTKKAWSHLEFKIGTRMRLTKNIATRLGLTNGAIGTVKEVIFREDRQIRPNLTLKERVADGYQSLPLIVLEMDEAHWNLSVPGFKGIARRVAIQSEKTRIQHKGTYYEREQLPLRPAHARTIHSCQGLTAEFGVLFDGRLCFSAFQAYVALSRARRLQDVHLVHKLTLEMLLNHIPTRQIIDREYIRLETRRPNSIVSGSSRPLPVKTRIELFKPVTTLGNRTRISPESDAHRSINKPSSPKRASPGPTIDRASKNRRTLDQGHHVILGTAKERELMLAHDANMMMATLPDYSSDLVVHTLHRNPHFRDCVPFSQWTLNTCHLDCLLPLLYGIFVNPACCNSQVVWKSELMQDMHRMIAHATNVEDTSEEVSRTVQHRFDCTRRVYDTQREHAGGPSRAQEAPELDATEILHALLHAERDVFGISRHTTTKCNIEVRSHLPKNCVEESLFLYIPDKNFQGTSFQQVVDDIFSNVSRLQGGCQLSIFYRIARHSPYILHSYLFHA